MLSGAPLRNSHANTFYFTLSHEKAHPHTKHGDAYL